MPGHAIVIIRYAVISLNNGAVSLFQGKIRSIAALITWLCEDFKEALLTVLLKKNTP